MPFSVFPKFDADTDGLLWGWKWDFLNLTYSFPTSPFDYPYYQGISGFEPLNATQQAAAHKIMANFDDVSGLEFTFTTVVGAGNIRFAEATQLNYFGGKGWHRLGSVEPGKVATAEGIPPDPTQFPNYAHGDTWFSNEIAPGVGQLYDNPILGNHAYTAGFMHEFGHGVGLKHGHMTATANGFTFPTLPADHDSQEYSVMTYRMYPGQEPAGAGTKGTPEYPQSLMQNDIAALQYMYGADFTTNSGNTTYKWNPSTGETFINGQGQGRSGSNYIFLTIWDGGGTDTYDFSNYKVDLSIDLRPGEWSKTSADQRAYLGDDHHARGSIANARLANGDERSFIENAKGGSGKDQINGNAANNTLDGSSGHDTLHGFSGADVLIGGRGNDYLVGGGGNDRLFGGRGRDVLKGEEGADLFIFRAANETLKGSSHDTIYFNGKQGDELDLSSIDADRDTGGNQTFKWIGGKGFSGADGLLRYSRGLLQADTDGDKVPNFEIKIVGSFGAGDILF